MRYPHRRVLLMGFMGAGKTTVGRLLGPMLGWEFVDADAAICERTGSTISQLFAERGEVAFRVLESEAIAALALREDVVVALGGGAVEHAATRRLLAADPQTLLVFLETPLAVSLARCVSEPNAVVRPVLDDRAALEARFALRAPLYRMAHLAVSTLDRTPDVVAREIAAAVRR